MGAFANTLASFLSSFPSRLGEVFEAQQELGASFSAVWFCEEQQPEEHRGWFWWCRSPGEGQETKPCAPLPGACCPVIL